MLLRVSEGVVVGIWMRVEMGMGVMGLVMRMGIGARDETWMRVGAREVAWRRSQSWSMMSAEVLVRLSLYLSRGLRVQAGTG